MAEIMLLLVFLLMLIVAARLVEDHRSLLDLQTKLDLSKDDLRKKTEENARLDEAMKKLKLHDAESYDLAQDFVKVEGERDAWREKAEKAQSVMEVLEVLKKDNPEAGADDLKKKMESALEDQKVLDELRKADPKTPPAEKIAALEEKSDFLDELQAENPEQPIGDTIAEWKAAAETVKHLAALDPEKSPEKLVEDLQEQAKAADVFKKRAKELSPNPAEGMKKLQQALDLGLAQMKSGKTGDQLALDLKQCQADNIQISKVCRPGTKPSCWSDINTGKAQFIFTIRLRDDGIYVKDNEVEGRRDDMEKLPIGGLNYDEPYDADAFVQAARPLYDWSVEQEPSCRFYVLVEDGTGNSKLTYKKLHKAVERIFFPTDVAAVEGD
jgi:hypothetical protein